MLLLLMILLMLKMMIVRVSKTTLFWEFLKWTTFLLILLLFIGCPLIQGYSTNSLLSVINASTWLLLTAWLNSWEFISQPANFVHPLILPFSVFPPVRTHSLGQRSFSYAVPAVWNTLTKSGHPAQSCPWNHHLKLTFFSRPTDCVCVWRGGDWGREREN